MVLCAVRCEQYSFSFNLTGWLQFATNFWSTELAMAGLCFMSTNASAIRLLASYIKCRYGPEVQVPSRRLTGIFKAICIVVVVWDIEY